MRSLGLVRTRLQWPHNWENALFAMQALLAWSMTCFGAAVNNLGQFPFVPSTYPERKPMALSRRFRVLRQIATSFAYLALVLAFVAPGAAQTTAPVSNPAPAKT